MNLRAPKSTRNSRGQSLVETVLMLPLLLLIVCNVVNLGYFFLVIVNLTGASRTATMYSTVGSSTPADPEAPNFVLNQVDITYTFSTLIPGTIFNIPLQASALCNSGTCQFVRSARMRAMD